METSLVSWLSCCIVLLLSTASAADEATKSSLQTNREKTIERALNRAEAKSNFRASLVSENQPRPQIIDSSNLNSPAIQTAVNPRETRPAATPIHQKREVVKEAVISRELDRLEFEFNIQPGIRLDELSWNKAGAGGSPNILSELSWKKILSYQLGGRAKVIWNQAIRLEGALDYGWIFSGENQDSDYALDDRGGEYSRSKNATNGDNVWDSSIGAGWQFPVPIPEDWAEFLTDNAWVTLLGGYSYHEQNLRITDGFQDIPSAGSFAGLNSTYQTQWKGPWAGIELSGSRNNFRGFSRFEYHWADYYGVGDWNLRADRAHPISFEHWADGRGLVFSFGGDMVCTKDLLVGLAFDVQNWKTRAGREQNYFADGTQIPLRFNEAKWQSYAGMLSATYHFNIGKGKRTDSTREFFEQRGTDN